MFKKTFLAAAVAATMVSGIAAAADSPHSLTGNVGLYSQYIFRGLTQTNGEPALQGGFDYSHANGFYAGTWASNISWLRDGGAYRAGGSGEFDLYGGVKGAFGKSDFTWDIGTLYYAYPGDANTLANPLNPKADAWEVYGALGWKWLSVKYSHVVSNKAFGVLDAGGTYYLDFGVTVPVTDKLNLIGHYGIQKFKGQDPRAIGIANNDALFSYDDWKIGLTYALPKDFTIGAFYTDTSSADAFGYGSTTDCGAFGCGVYPKNIAKGTGTLFISKTF
ncbi:MAG: hypothetical protein HYY78_09230 [Betaproteobacteria bacterium]|nr:hypothetical protein [Betaproteobacteria bacterium]